MTTVTIPQLPIAVGIAGPEQFEAVQGGISVSVTASQIAALAGSGGGGTPTGPQSANTVYAGPSSGGVATPTFRNLVTADFPTPNANAGTFGDSTHAARFTVDATGRITAASQSLISTTDATVGTYGDATHVASVVVDANGRITGISSVGITTGGTGTVTSVALTVPSEFAVSGSPVTSSGTFAVTWNAAVTAAHGGTGQASYAVGDILYASGATALSKLADVATGNALISGGVTTAPTWGKIGLTTHVSGTLGAANGGTGLASYTVGDLVYASGATALASLADVATGNVLLSGGIGVAPAYGKVNLATMTTGSFGVAQGGTGLTTYVTGDMIIATSSSVLASLADVATGNVLLSGGIGVVPAWGKVALATAVSGSLLAVNGGTGQTSYTQGDLLVAASSTTLTKVSAVATGQVLRSAGVATAPAWGAVNLTTDVTGILPVANGGTGLSANTNVCAIVYVIDGGGSAIGTGVKGDLQLPFNCTIQSWTLLADQSGSIVVDLWMDTFANYPPTIADVITASAKPTLSTADHATSSTLTAWTTAIPAGSTIRFNVNSAATVTRVTVTLQVVRT